MSLWLTAMWLAPLLGTGVVLLVPRSRGELVKQVALLVTLVPLFLGICLWSRYDSQATGLQFVEQQPWIPLFHIHYYLGLDGLSMPFVLLTVFLCPICILASWHIEKQIHGYCAMFLLLECAMLGVFLSLDFFLFYVFWEMMLLPMYFLIGIWGGPRKEYAAIKFFLFTLFGSVFLLAVMIAFYLLTGSFDLTQLRDLLLAKPEFTRLYRQFAFVALFVAFAVKVPVVPFHTWLPDAHVEAPTAISVILAGILLKMGTYGLFRVSYEVLPDAAVWFALPMAILGLINIVYGAFCAMAQDDLKKLVAYSSISHMGYVLLGMAVFNETAIHGAILQMFNHGTITAMLFLLVGVIYDRVHHRYLVYPSDYHDPALAGKIAFGGMVKPMPVWAGVTAVAYFAALGLPGLSGFISEALVFLGAFRGFPIIVILATSGILLTAGYMLWAYQRIFLGPVNPKYAQQPDMTLREIVCLFPLGVVVVLLGVWPKPILSLLHAPALHFVDLIRSFGG